MKRRMNWLVVILLVAGSGFSVRGGDLNKDYMAATKPGDWITQELTSPDGSSSVYSTKRLPDQDGRVVVELTVKVLAGAGEGSESKTIVHLPVDFNFGRDWLSYGRFTEKMTMEYGGMVMPIDDATLEVIRNSSKDYRGALTFSGTEEVGGYVCDRYTYTVDVAGPAPQKESGELWMNESVPFGIVRQAAKTIAEDGATVSSYDIRLTDVGHEIAADEASDAEEAVEAIPDGPVEVDFLDGYQTEKFALDISVVLGTRGQMLTMNLRNKMDNDVVVKIAAGSVSIPGDLPVEQLLIIFSNDDEITIPANESSPPITVEQYGIYGPVEGSFTLSFYEGKAYFSGSVTVDTIHH